MTEEAIARLRAALEQINEWASFSAKESINPRLLALQQIGVHARAAIDSQDAALKAAYAEGRRDEREDLAKAVSNPARLFGKPGELPRYVSQCWGCEGFPSGTNNPCDVCGRAAMKPQGSEP